MAVTWKGNDDLRPLLKPIADVDEDPKNVNLHPDENMEALKTSFSEFGQTKPIVIWRESPEARPIAIAGNGSLRSMIALGWTHLATSEYRGTEARARAYAIADNWTPRLSVFDDEALAKQMEWIGERYTFDASPKVEFDAAPAVTFETAPKPRAPTLADIGIAPESERAAQPARERKPARPTIEAALAQVGLPGLTLRVRNWTQLMPETRANLVAMLRAAAGDFPEMETPITVAADLLESI